MTPKLYHRDIFLPEAFISHLVGKSFNLGYTRHARLALMDEGIEIPPRSVRISDASQIVEVERLDGVTTKVVVRSTLALATDLIFVLRHIEDGAAMVITLWVNSIYDKHATLKKEPYATS